jgi:tetratricopeptide (TPR) repeat protein
MTIPHSASSSSQTDLKISHLTMPAADLGQDNPFPQLPPRSPDQAPIALHPNVPEELRTYIGYGVGKSAGDPCLPYSVQDGYNRERRPAAFKVAVLENARLRATILLERGGRLWSLLDKASGRELIEVNPVFQPANLGIRNAWFSGGVEWNCGVRGHTPLGCDPLFAAQLRHPDGWPVLRLWEFERIRAVPFQIDFLLPPDSRFLHVRVGLKNPFDREIPFYWWSNIAVSNVPKLRVLTPSTSALTYGYEGGLQLVDVPAHEGRDLTDPATASGAADYFFNIPDGTRPWITALDQDGTGLIQTSTSAQRGRKLFVWGNNPGGRQWQAFLTEGDHPYVEIQAGVARTQYESFPFPAHSRMSWLESYGLMQVDPALSHGSDWVSAVDAARARLEEAWPQESAEELLASTEVLFDTPPEHILQMGSGWGALEEARRVAAGEPGVALPGSPFPPESVGTPQAAWHDLLKNGVFPPQDEPVSWMIQKEWCGVLENSTDDSWLAWLHRGVMRYAHGEDDAASAAWETSLTKRENVWALRNLGFLAQSRGAIEEASGHYHRALCVGPPEAIHPALAVEAINALLASQRSREALALLESLPEAMTRQGRLRALHAKACLAEGQLDQAEVLLGSDLVTANLREGEQLLNQLWWELRAQQEAKAAGTLVTETIRQRVRIEPIPAHLDFRQS